MLKEDFINGVKELGMTVEEGIYYYSSEKSIVVWNMSEDGIDETRLHISEQKRFDIVIHSGFEDLKEDVQEKLYKIATEYASTKIDERYPQKKYYIVLKDMEGVYKFINYDTSTNEVFIHNHIASTISKVSFTKSEIESLGLLKFANSPLFKLVEVKEEKK